MPPASTSASDKPTVTKTIREDQKTAASPFVYNRIRKLSAVALVEVYTQAAYDGPDTLVLRTTEGGAPADRMYWKELVVGDQTQEHDRIECFFSLKEHEGRAQTEDDLWDVLFTLAWRPSGGAEKEVLLVENEPYEEVWSTGEFRSVMATMVAARFRECSALSFPEEGGLEVDLPDGLRELYEPVEEEQVRMFAHPDPEESLPVKTRPSPDEETSGSEGPAPGAELPEVPPPPGERWITIHRVRRWAADDATGETTLLGLYRVTEDGSYQRAQVEGEKVSVSTDEQSDVLLPVGDVAGGVEGHFARLLLGSPTHSRVKATTALMKKGVGLRTFVPAATPLFFRQPPGGKPPTPQQMGPMPVDPEEDIPVYPHRHVGDGNEGPGAELYLVNPLWSAERRLQAAEAAHRHYCNWMKTVGWADGPSSLVGGLCYDERHRRGYLTNQLVSATKEELREGTVMGGYPGEGSANREAVVKEKYDLTEQWAPFTPEQPVAARDGDGMDGEAGVETSSASGPLAGSTELLGQFLYGLRCKRAFLAWNRARAARRATTVLTSSFMLQLVFDLERSEEQDGLKDRVLNLFPRLVAVGGELPLEEVKSIDHLRQFLDKEWLVQDNFREQFDGFQAPLLEDEGPIGEAILSDPFLDEVFAKALLSLAGKSAVRAHKVAMAFAPKILGAGSGTSNGLPAGAEQMAHFLMRASHGSEYDVRRSGDTLRLHRGAPTEAEVVLTPKKGGFEIGGTVRRRWQLELSGAVRKDFDRATESLSMGEAGAAGASSALRLLNALVAVYGVLGAHREGEIGLGEAISIANLPVEAAALADEATEYSVTARGVATLADGTIPGRVWGLLLDLGPWFDVLEGAWSFYQAATDSDRRGQATTEDPNILGMIGALCSTAGGIGVTMAGSVSGAVISGVGLLLGGLLPGIDYIRDRIEMEAADPLADWLPSGSLWGKEFDQRGTPESREALFEAVRPDPQADPTDFSTRGLGGRPLPKALTAQTEALTEQAFYFPTSVGVRTVLGSFTPVGLELSIAVGYLPSYGTLMVDAQATTDGSAPIPIQCAVHYVETEEGLEYRVLPLGAALTLPDLSEMSLPEWVGDQTWARAQTGEAQLPNGESVEAAQLQVHVGSWPEHRYSDEEHDLAAASEGGAEYVLGNIEGWPERYKKRYEGAIETIRGEAARQEKIREDEETRVDPKSILPVPSGLGLLLESGGFRVTGTVYFCPLRSFDPSPSIPTEDTLAAREEIDFVYP